MQTCRMCVCVGPRDTMISKPHIRLYICSMCSIFLCALPFDPGYTHKDIEFVALQFTG